MCQQDVPVYREQARSFSAGVRLQLTAPASDMKLANRELGTVERVEPTTRNSSQTAVRSSARRSAMMCRTRAD